MPDYKTGDILEFPYLWAWQKQRGETEGRKDRPCCLALISNLPSGKHRIFLVPITTVPPTPELAAVQVPQIEAKRAGLHDHVRQWVILSEWNADILEEILLPRSRGTQGAVFQGVPAQADRPVAGSATGWEAPDRSPRRLTTPAPTTE